MAATRLRLLMIALLVVAAVLGGIGHKRNEPWVVWLSYVVFIVTVGVFIRWRRLINGRVLDREDKTRR